METHAATQLEDRTAGMGSRPFQRRSLLRAGLVGGVAAAMLSACGPVVGPRVGETTTQVYLGLGKARQLVVLDAISDAIVERTSFQGLGDRAVPWQVAVAPAGNAAILPISPISAKIPWFNAQARTRATTTASLFRGASPLSTVVATVTGDTSREQTNGYSWITLTPSGDGPAANGTAEAVASSWGKERRAQRMTSDNNGHAYIVVGDTLERQPAYVAVMDLVTGTTQRYCKLCEAGESVLEVLVHPNGQTLYASIWHWDEQTTASPGNAAKATSTVPTRGRLIALDTQTGKVRTEVAFGDSAAVISLAIAGSPPGTKLAASPGASAVYAVISSPGPVEKADADVVSNRRYTLMAYDDRQLEPLATWMLDHRPGAITVTPDGSRSYLLSHPTSMLPWSQRLSCMDLSSGKVVEEWPLPPGCFSMAYSTVGKLYIPDALGDTLWRVNTMTNTLVGSIPMPGAPIAVAARPD